MYDAAPPPASSLSPDSPPDPSAPPALMSAQAAARLLAMSHSTFRALEGRALLPAPVMRSGKLVRWSVEELRAWCRAGCPPRARWEPVWRKERV